MVVEDANLAELLDWYIAARVVWKALVALESMSD